VSIHEEAEGVWKIRWREQGRNRSLLVHGSHELAKKIHRKKLSARDENRHLDVKKEINFRMTALIDRYTKQYGSQKASHDREESILEGIRRQLGHLFVREADGIAIDRWYRDLMEKKRLSEGTAVRHFNVMHHMMGKAPRFFASCKYCTFRKSGTAAAKQPPSRHHFRRRRWRNVQCGRHNQTGRACEPTAELGPVVYGGDLGVSLRDKFSTEPMRPYGTLTPNRKAPDCPVSAPPPRALASGSHLPAPSAAWSRCSPPAILGLPAVKGLLADALLTAEFGCR